MKPIFTLAFCLLLAQLLPAQPLPSCPPDSVLGYYFETPTDSIFSYREIFFDYGDQARSRYLYLGIELNLEEYDSLVFDGQGRTIFQEHWAYNFDSNAVILEERTFYYPYGNTTLHDSVVTHSLNFFTGVLAPDSKTEYSYNTNDLLEEEVSFQGDPFGVDGWYLSEKRVYFYDSEAKIDSLESYQWNGLEFTLTATEYYEYNAMDSLAQILRLSAGTGQPVQKAEFEYDLIEHTTKITGFFWDATGMEWAEQAMIIYDYDDLGRLEAQEFVFNFFGWDGGREEFEYHGEQLCPWRKHIYEYTGPGSWSFAASQYYYPVPMLSPANEVKDDLEVSIFPNPATEGVWIEAPKGAGLKIIDLTGHMIWGGASQGKNYVPLHLASPQLLLLQTRLEGTLQTCRFYFQPK